MIKENTVGTIDGDKLTLFAKKRTYDIYDYAFFELRYNEIKIRKYIFSLLFLLNAIVFVIFSENVFINIFGISTILSCLSFALNINPKSYYVQLSSKNFRFVTVPIKKSQIDDAVNLIEDFKKFYKIIDDMELKKRRASSMIQ